MPPPPSSPPFPLHWQVDSTDHDRLEEARDQLHSMLADDLLRNVSVLVLANKQVPPQKTICLILFPATNRPLSKLALSLTSLGVLSISPSLSLPRAHSFSQLPPQDLPRAATTSQVCEKMRLSTLPHRIQWRIEATNAVSGEGIYEGMAFFEACHIHHVQCCCGYVHVVTSIMSACIFIPVAMPLVRVIRTLIYS